MSVGHRHHTVAYRKNMAILAKAQSDPKESPPPESNPHPDARLSDSTFASSKRREVAPPVADTVTTMVYEPIPSTATILRANQVSGLLPGSVETASVSGPLRPQRMSDREISFIVTAALFGMGVLLLGAGIACFMRRRGRERLAAPRGLDTAMQEQGLCRSTDFDESTWGTPIDDKDNILQPEDTADSPRMVTMPKPTLRLSHPCVTSAPAQDAQITESPPVTDLTVILEQFEQRLHQEETDIALALHIAFGDDPSSADNTRYCAPFFAGSEDDVTTMLSLQAGMESVGKRAGGTRNRARQGSNASASSQATTVSVEGFSSHSSSRSSMTSVGTMSDVEENAEEAEEDMVYEVKRAQTRSMEIQKGKLIAWQPSSGGLGPGVRLMVTGPSTTTLGTASSGVSVDLDDFPCPPSMR